MGANFHCTLSTISYDLTFYLWGKEGDCFLAKANKGQNFLTWMGGGRNL